MTFGRYLLRHGIVSEEQLRDATAATVLFGGRLGTRLVELGALAPDQLERLLAAHLKVVAAPPGRLEKPSSETGSLFAAAVERGQPTRGAPEPGGVDARVARLLRRVEPAEVAFFPIRIGERGVNLLYADNGFPALGEKSCAALETNEEEGRPWPCRCW